MEGGDPILLLPDEDPTLMPTLRVDNLSLVEGLSVAPNQYIDVRAAVIFDEYPGEYRITNPIDLPVDAVPFSSKLSFPVEPLPPGLFGGRFVCRLIFTAIDQENRPFRQVMFYQRAVLGKNPASKQVIRDFITSTIQPEDVTRATVIAYMESSFRQYYAAPENTKTPPRKPGRPVWGPPHGFGVMQPDPVSDDRQIWDWRANIREGCRRLSEIHTSALDNMHYMQSVAERADPQHQPLPDYTKEELSQEMYFRYNTGKPLHQWDSSQRSWTFRSYNSDRIQKGYAYVEKGIKLEQMLAQGQKPTDWDAPI